MAKSKAVSKNWFASRTIWFNLLSAVVSLAIALQAFPVPEWALGVLGVVVTGGNMLLRLVTNTRIE
jgi:hypothetical protein